MHNTLNKMNKITKDHPLILVCYMDRELMAQKEIMHHISQGINQAIAEREANAMAFFVPTDGPERMECINPIHTSKKQTNEINKMIEDIRRTFDVGQGADDDFLGDA